MTLAVAVVVIATLYLAREVLIPITLAVLLSFVLAPLVDLLRWARLGRVPSVFLAAILAVGVILALAGVIGTQVAQLATDIPRYASTIEEKVNTVRGYTIGRLSTVANRLGKQVERAGNSAAQATGVGANAPEASSDTTKPMPVEVHQPTPSPLELAQRILSPVLSPLATLGIVFVVAIFILLQREDLRDRLIRLFGSYDLLRTTAAMDDAARRLSRYFLTQLGLNAAFGCAIGGGLFLIGVPSPILWGILAALMRFVPYVGAFLAGALPVALAAAVDPGWSMVIWTAALFLVAEPVMGQVVEPVVYGHSTGLSPVSVVVAAIFWTWLWGPIGLILSMPLTLCLVVLGRHIDRLHFMDVLLGDQPALTPIESFYQRMLADDADEALHQAELLLKERSLSSYYDEVALKGLALAAHDRERGVLTPDQLYSIKEATEGLVADLADQDDTDPPAAKKGDSPAGPTREELPKQPAPESLDREAPSRWQTGRPVLCVAGHGPLDEAASAMLAQLLEKHGLRAHILPHKASARSSLVAAQVPAVAMVCVSYLAIRGSPSHLRYLVRRLRRRVGDVPVLVGFWQADEAVLNDERLLLAAGADRYVTSLRDAVNACIDTVRAGSKSAPDVESKVVLGHPGPRRSTEFGARI
jgi:predicted PurR-regulated permease PerM